MIAREQNHTAGAAREHQRGSRPRAAAVDRGRPTSLSSERAVKVGAWSSAAAIQEQGFDRHRRAPRSLKDPRQGLHPASEQGRTSLDQLRAGLTKQRV